MDIRQSIERVLESKQVFGEIFYEEFFRRTPHAHAHFEGVDMERQALMLTMALPAIAHHAMSPSPATKQYLQQLAGQHEARKIPRSLYPRWSEAMMAALEHVIGDDWDAGLAEEWESALASATETMVRSYDGPVGI